MALQKRNVVELGAQIAYQLQPGTQAVNVFSLGAARVSASAANDKVYNLGLEREVTIAAEGHVIYLSGLGRAIVSEYSDGTGLLTPFVPGSDFLVCSQRELSAFPDVTFTADGVGYLMLEYSYETAVWSAGTLSLTNLTTGSTAHVIALSVPNGAGRDGAFDSRFYFDIIPGNYRLELDTRGATIVPGSLDILAAYSSTKPQITLRPYEAPARGAGVIASCLFYTINQRRVQGMPMDGGGGFSPNGLLLVTERFYGQGDWGIIRADAITMGGGALDLYPVGQLVQLDVQAYANGEATVFVIAGEPK